MSTLGPNDMSLIIGKPVTTLIKQYQPFSVVFGGVCSGESKSSEANDYWSVEMRQKGLKR